MESSEQATNVTSALLDETAVVLEVVHEELTQSEKQLRHQLELKVERAFYFAGCALLQLRDRRLYRSTHQNFSDYCRDRFGFTHRYVNYLIAGSQVFENLQKGTNGSHQSDSQVGTNGSHQSDSQIGTNGSHQPDSQIGTNGSHQPDSQIGTNGSHQPDSQVGTNGSHFSDSQVGTNGSQILPTSERQVRPLTTLEPDEQREVWQEAVTRSGGKIPSNRLVKSIVEQRNSANATPPPIPYSVGDVVEIRAGCNPTLRKHDGMWGIVTHIGSFSCTVHISVRNVSVQCKPDEMDLVDPKYTVDILAVHQRITALMQRGDLSRTAIAVVETLVRQTCFSPDDLWLLEKLEERYGIE